VPRLASYTLAFALQLSEKQGKTSVRLPEKFRLTLYLTQGDVLYSKKKVQMLHAMRYHWIAYRRADFSRCGEFSSVNQVKKTEGKEKIKLSMPLRHTGREYRYIFDWSHPVVLSNININ